MRASEELANRATESLEELFGGHEDVVVQRGVIIKRLPDTIVFISVTLFRTEQAASTLQTGQLQDTQVMVAVQCLINDTEVGEAELYGVYATPIYDKLIRQGWQLLDSQLSIDKIGDDTYRTIALRFEQLAV